MALILSSLPQSTNFFVTIHATILATIIVLFYLLLAKQLVPQVGLIRLVTFAHFRLLLGKVKIAAFLV